MIDCRTVVKNRRRADARTQFFPKQHSSRPTAFEPSKTLKCAGRIPHRWNERDEGSQIALIAFRTSFFRRPLAVAPAAAVASLAESRCLRLALSSCRSFPPTAATLAPSLSERPAPLPLERWAPSPSTLARTVMTASAGPNSVQIEKLIDLFLASPNTNLSRAAATS